MITKLRDIINKLKGEPRKGMEVPPNDVWPNHIKILNEDDFQDFIKKYLITLIDFHSPICKPCRAMKPRLRKLSKEYRGEAVFSKVNITKNRELADKYDIISVPTFIIFKYGRQERFFKGKLPMSSLKKSLDDVLLDIDNEWFLTG